MLNESQLKIVSSLINTSVEDCKISLQYLVDVELLEAVLKEAVAREHVSRAKVLMSRLREVKRAGVRQC